jgi:hypothetical protein
MKKLLPVLILAAVAVIGLDRMDSPSGLTGPGPTPDSDQALATAFAEREKGFQTSGSGVVVSILPDDDDGSRHQRFILRLASGQTLLVAHNIDLAPRIPSLRAGDTVEFYGEYEWNAQGGVIHWTHHDPAGRHPAGWLKHKGRIFQ